MGKKVSAKVLGGQLVTNLQGSTVSDIMSAIGIDSNHTVNMNGEQASANSEVPDGAYLVFTKAVKGNAKTLLHKGDLVIVEVDGEIMINGIKLTTAQITKLFKVFGELLDYDIK